ncbi:hypothetical protein EPN18_04055 [bacterium]|nr:MAG: hypothetical protein EPN18_04055 [bacterium]
MIKSAFLSMAIIFMGVSSVFAQDDYKPLSGALWQPQTTLIAGNIDKCTERYNYCVASCQKQKEQCEARGNDKEYCGPAYTSCALGCENHMKACWRE